MPEIIQKQNFFFQYSDVVQISNYQEMGQKLIVHFVHIYVYVKSRLARVDFRQLIIWISDSSHASSLLEIRSCLLPDFVIFWI